MTVLGTNLISQIWPQLDATGALSTASYRSTTPGTITSTSVVTGELSAGSTTSTGIKFLREDFDERLIDGTLVQLGDFMIRFPADKLSVTPDQDDKVVIGSDTYSVVRNREPVDGASYRLQLRLV